MNLPLISRFKAARPLMSRDTLVPSSPRRQECRRSLSVAILGLFLISNAFAAPFTPGNLVIYRVGNGTNPLSTSGALVFLDEYHTSGTFVQTISLPEDSPGVIGLVASSTNVAEGLLTRSISGRYLALTGFKAAVTATDLPSSVASSVSRSVGTATWDGVVSVTTALQNFSSGTSPRSALTSDNGSFWVSGGSGGLHLATLGATSSTQLTASLPASLRQIQAFGGQLYVSINSGTLRLATVGTGLPVTSGQTFTNLPGISSTNSTSPYGFFLADLSTAVAGNDTLYIADDSLGLQKFSLVSGTWTANGSVGTDADDYRGLTATVNGTSVTLFATIKGGAGATGGGQLVKLTDTSGYNATISGTPAVLATAATNTAFRGVAFAPYNLPDLTVDLAAPATALAGTSFAYTLTPRNIGNVAASGISLGFVVPSGLTIGAINGASGFTAFATGNIVNFTGGSLAPGASATLTINVTSATANTYTPAAQAAFIDPSNAITEADETNNGSMQTVSTVVSLPTIPAAITTQPASQTITSGSTATLTVTATGNPAPSFQWYQGTSGDTTTPVGTNSASFTTSALTTTTSYWVKVTNAANPTGVNSDTATVTADSAFAQTTRLWTGSTNGAWLTTTSWNPTGTFPGEAPNTVVAGEGAATDIMGLASANGSTNIGINMNTLTAGSGGLGLSLGGIDFTNTINLQIGNSSTLVNGLLQLNGATLRSVPKTLIRVAGSGNLTIANVNTGAGTQTMGLRLGITDGIFVVGAGRTLTISSAVTEAAVNSGFTKTGPGTLNFTGPVNYSGPTLVSAGKLAVLSTHGGTGAATVSADAALTVTASGTSQWQPSSLTLANLCTLEFNSLQNPGTAIAPLQPTAAVGTVSGVTVNISSISGTVLINNRYPLLGNQGGTTTGYTLGAQPPGFTGHLDFNGTTLVYVVDAAPDVWTGANATNPTFWDIGTTTNWTGKAAGNSPAGSYADGDEVLFNDSASSVGVVLQTAVAPGNIIFANNTKIYTISASGASGIGGSGTLTKNGTGAVILGTGNSYTGVTTVNSGTLSISQSSALGSTASATTIIGGNGSAGVALSLSSATSPLTLAEPLNFFGNASGRAVLTNTSGQNHILSGAIDVSSDTNLVQFSINAQSAATPGGVTISGDITGTLTNNAGFLLRGATFSGGTSSANFITGNITLIGGGLTKTDANTWTIGATGKTYSAPTIASAVGTLKMGVADYITASAPQLIMGNSSGGSTGIFDLNGFNQTVRAIVYAGGSSTGTRTVTSTTGTPVLTINNLVDHSPTNGTAANSVVLSGSLALTKQGAGKLTFSGSNTNTGAYTVAGGTLQFARQISLYNNLPASWTAANLNVQSGGTLAFNVGGTDEFTTANVTTLLANLAASSSATQGMNAGSSFGFDTTNASGGSFTIANVIADSTGASGGARGLTKSGAGTLVISGTNSYSGPTTITGGTLAIGSSSSLPTATDLVMTGGKLDLNGQNATIQSLAVNGTDVIIDFGTNNNPNTLQITAGAVAGWTGNLLIHHFNPSTDQLIFGTSADGINENTARASFVDPVGFPPGTYALIAGADGAALPNSTSGGIPPAITSQPANRTISSSSSATLTVTAIGSAPLAYQWYQGNSGDTTMPVGTNSASFTTPALIFTTPYWVQVSNGVGAPRNSNTATVTVTAPQLPDLIVSLSAPAVASVAQNFNYTITVRNLGDTPASTDVSFVLPSTLQFTGSTAPPGFTGGHTGGGVGSFTGNFGAGSTSVFTITVQSPDPGTITTAFDAVYVNASASVTEDNETNNGSGTPVSTVIIHPPTITTQPANKTITSGSAATLSVAATGTGPLTYQWYRGNSGDTSIPVGTNSESFTTPALAVNTNYWVQVSNSSGQSVNSNTASVSINLLVNGSFEQPGGNLSVYAPNSTTTPGWTVSKGDIEILGSYWPASDGFMSVDMNGNSAGALFQDVISLIPGATYRIQFDLSGNPDKQSAPVKRLLVSAADQSGEFDFDVTSTSSANMGWVGRQIDFIAASATARIQFESLSPGNQGPALDNVSLVLTNVALVVIPPAIASQPTASQTIPSGSTTTLSVTASGIPTPALQWYRGNSGNTSNPVSGANSTTFTTPALTTTTSYWVQATNTSSPPANSNTAVVTVTAPPAITTQPASQRILSGNTATLNVAASGSPAPTFQWYRGNSGDTTNLISGATSATFVTPNLTTETNYWARATNSINSADSQTAVVGIKSSNANLAALALNQGTLSPVFDPLTLNYSASVLNSVSSINVTPTVADSGATVKVNGNTVSSASPRAVSLLVGSNSIPVLVTAEDGGTKTYTLTVTRAAAIPLTTEPASDVATFSATFNGTVTPNGPATVYFRYGTSPSYGNRTADMAVTGNTLQSIQTPVTGLISNRLYYYQLVVENGLEAFYGNNRTFTTLQGDPIAATGTPFGVTTAEATLVGAVDLRGLAGFTYFEYGQKNGLISTTAEQALAAAAGVRDINAPITGLIPNQIYVYRIVARSAGGTTKGADIEFTATTTGSGGTGTPSGPPTAITGVITDVQTTSALLAGSSDSRGGSTIVYFEYGTTTSYGQRTETKGIGNVNGTASFSIRANGLNPGTLYHYRLVAENSAGATTADNEGTFTTRYLSPSVSTGGVTLLSTTSVQLSGTVRANGLASVPKFRYGTNPSLLTLVKDATPSPITGYAQTTANAEIDNLRQGTTYYYQLEASNTAADQGTGIIRSFDVGVLSGLDQRFPDSIQATDRQGSLTLTLTPPAIGSGWRFTGEPGWRASGSSATGLTAGDRVVEYRPVASYLQPQSETVSIPTGTSTIALTRAYQPSGQVGNGSLRVTLKPDAVASAGLAVADRAQWRLAGETTWRDSGSVASGLPPGGYVIESKQIPLRDTPAPANAVVANGQETGTSITYYLAAPDIGTSPEILGFTEVSTNAAKPFGYVGQILSDAGAGTGFAVKARVVATAGHVMFDSAKLASATGVRWLFERDAGIHEPVPTQPRGFYLMTGYAAQRTLENTPGESTPASQNLDAAAMYFAANVSRNGYSGYLASDLAENEFVISPLQKTMVGYPVERVPAGSIGKMHATPAAPVAFAAAFGRTCTTAQIRGGGGMSGGPLCVQTNSGVWYPAAIFLGGNNQTVVRTIDSDVVDLFGFAEASSTSATGATGGTGAVTLSDIGGTAGAVTVLIGPTGARAAGAGWRINAGDSYLISGAQISISTPNTYTVQLSTVPGFLPPTPQPVQIVAGKLALLNFTYQEIILPPVITSAAGIAVVRGQPLSYQIAASNIPTAFNLSGNLPTGLSFNSATGRISGTPIETGAFPVIVSAENAGGVGTKLVTLSSLPVISGQSVAAIRNQALSYQVQSGESGGGLSWSAANLPNGLSISTITGIISGAPSFAGIFTAQVAVTKNNVTSTATLTFNITGTPPAFTIQPPSTTSVEFGTGTTFTVVASGEPAPSFQWFRGVSGDTSQELIGATSATLNTLPLTTAASYWVRASSISGSANSTAVAVSIAPSKNPNLSGLVASSGSLVPAFNPTVTSYQMTVDQAVSSINLTPFVQISQTTVLVNNQPVLPGVPSGALPLAAGSNLIQMVTTAGDGTSKNYTLQVTRLSPPTLPVTTDASAITHFSATLNGTVTPNGNGSYYFEYGTTAAYGSRTNTQGISAQQSTQVSQSIASLGSSTGYFYRIVFQADGAPLYGQSKTFTTAPAPPLVFTGNPVNVTTATARFTGGVDPKGLPFSYKFYYGQTAALGQEIAFPQRSPNSNGNPLDVFFDLPVVIPNATYFYQLEATTTGGTVKGETIRFTADTSGGTGDGIADSAPTLVTLNATDINTYSAALNGSVIPNDGSTLAWFEYGTTIAYGKTTEPRELIGNGNQLRLAKPVLISGLGPATTYHFRIRGLNSKGESIGGNSTFTTVFNPPIAYVGTAEATSPNSVIVRGQVDPRGSAAAVSFEYGTDGVNFPNAKVSNPGSVNGSLITPVSALLENLKPSVTYYLRVRAERSGEPPVFSEVSTFLPGALIGLFQEFPQATAAADRSGQLIVTSLPSGTGAWRFTGETKWREMGIPATGLTTSDRVIEFQPVFGLIQPMPEPVSIVSGQAAATVEGLYYNSAAPGTAALTVTILPSSVSDPAVPVASRAQWRLAGVAGEPWRNSGESALEMPNGTHLIEFKAIPARRTPPNRIVKLDFDEARLISETYFLTNSPILNPPAPVSYESALADTVLPNAFVGQLRSEAGTYSGFVVKKRVVATAAQAVINDATFAFVSDIQWLWQPDPGNHEPKPLTPRGVYIFDGYAAQRAVEETPGTLSSASQNQNVAAVFFSENAARGGFSGFLSSNAETNPYLISADLKSLAGYPVAGVSPTNLGRLHATSPSASLFTQLFDRTYESTSIRGFGGMVGGPLSIRSSGGAYYPAAIFVGGTNRGIVRAIDSNVIDLLSRADSSANGGDDDVGGGISLTSFDTIGSSSNPGAISLTIEPASARAANPAPTWKLTSGFNTSLAFSGDTKGGLTAGSYSVSLSAIPGFETPTLKTVKVEGGILNKYTFTYKASNLAPSISNTGNLSISEDTTSGPLAITLSDPDDAESTLELTASSSNTTLIPQKNITFGGTGANRTVRLTPVVNQTGTATITLTVSDGALESKDTFTLTVAPVNDRPAISTIANQSVAVTTPIPAIPFTVSDLETPLASLLLSATSSNTTLVPASSVVLSGSGTNRTIKVTPLTGKLGTTTIALSVNDGALGAVTTFTLTVTGNATEIWRAQNFNSAINSGPGADTADPDGDGSTNIAEYTAGTNPMSAMDVFKVSATTKTGNLFLITVQGKTGRKYVLQRTTDLSTGTWTSVASTSPLAADAVISLTDPNASAARGFYRVTAELANP